MAAGPPRPGQALDPSSTSLANLLSLPPAPSLLHRALATLSPWRGALQPTFSVEIFLPVGSPRFCPSQRRFWQPEGSFGPAGPRPEPLDRAHSAFFNARPSPASPCCLAPGLGHGRPFQLLGGAEATSQPRAPFSMRSMRWASLAGAPCIASAAGGWASGCCGRGCEGVFDGLRAFFPSCLFFS